MTHRMTAKEFTAEIDYWAGQGLKFREIADVTGIGISTIRNRYQLKKCSDKTAALLEESRDALEMRADAANGSLAPEIAEEAPQLTRQARIAEGIRENYEESNAPESCADPSPMAYAKGCRCKDCYYLAMKYRERRK